ncbi:MAG: GNAT family N-acetyltransferase [Aquificae bacterium]|nr:GNAT family N-acetyltransferase [Aquificota bacterium]
MERKIRIREFRQEDLNRVIEIGKGFPPTSIEGGNRFTVKKVALWVDQVVGFLSGDIVFSEASINLLAVCPSFRRKGIAGALIDSFVSLSREKGAERVVLEVSSKNIPAVNLYRKKGFKEAYLRKKYYRDGSDAIVMVLPV